MSISEDVGEVDWENPIVNVDDLLLYENSEGEMIIGFKSEDPILPSKDRLIKINTAILDVISTLYKGDTQ